MTRGSLPHLAAVRGTSRPTPSSLPCRRQDSIMAALRFDEDRGIPLLSGGHLGGEVCRPRRARVATFGPGREDWADDDLVQQPRRATLGVRDDRTPGGRIPSVPPGLCTHPARRFAQSRSGARRRPGARQGRIGAPGPACLQGARCVVGLLSGPAERAGRPRHGHRRQPRARGGADGGIPQDDRNGLRAGGDVARDRGAHRGRRRDGHSGRWRLRRRCSGRGRARRGRAGAGAGAGHGLARV
jgi:hypothetical protein